jgi:hypothetical protein
MSLFYCLNETNLPNNDMTKRPTMVSRGMSDIEEESTIFVGTCVKNAQHPQKRIS